MARRYTTEDVRNARGRMQGALRSAGIVRNVEAYRDGVGPVEAVALGWTHLSIQEGSSTYGNAFRMHFKHPQTGALYTVPGFEDFLGMTKRDAVTKLDAYADGINAVLAIKV